MKIIFSAVVFACVVLAGATTSYAQETKPVQLALFNPAQIFKEDVSIKGVRLNLLYGKNHDMTGLDLGIANWTTGDFKGVGWAFLVNSVEGDGVGWLDGVVNLVAGEFKGLEVGIYNGVGQGTGVQLGWVNVSKGFEGLQFGFVNYTDDMHGLQIGIVNIINNKEKLKFLPIVNWKF
jgi:hypothetical protein